MQERVWELFTVQEAVWELFTVQEAVWELFSLYYTGLESTYLLCKIQLGNHL